MKKRIPDDIIYSKLENILSYMKEHRIGLNDTLIIDDTHNYFFPSILHVFIRYSFNDNYAKEVIKLGANVNIVDRSSEKQSIFETIIDTNNLKLLHYCLPYFKLKSNYRLMDCVYSNIKYSTKIDRKAKLLNRLISMFNQDKWKRIKYFFETDPYLNAKTLDEIDNIFFCRNLTCGKCKTMDEGEKCDECAFNNPDYEYPFDSLKTIIPIEEDITFNLSTTDII